MELVEIERFDDQEKLALFNRLALEVYRDDPVWVPQSEGAFQQRFEAAQQLGTPWMRPVICVEGERPLARAAAILTPGAADAHGLPQGYIGFFECHQNFPEAGQRVLEHCEQLLCARGVKSVQAPRSDNMLMGLLVKGFGLPQTIMTPHNPPYYQEILTGQGYLVHERLVCFQFQRESVPHFDLKLAGYHTRTFRRDCIEEETRVLNELQAEIFRAHPGYIPRSLAEDRAMIASFLPMLDDDLVILAEDSANRAVGILICLPDIYQAFKGQPVDSARLISIGVVPPLVTRGIGVLMGGHLVRNLLEKGYRSLEASWIRDDNLLPQLMARRFKGQPGREFALFEKKLEL